MAHSYFVMTAAEQKELFRKALALPEKARLDLYKRLVKSLETSGEKDKATRPARSVTEPPAVYGRKKVSRRAKDGDPKREVLTKKEWNDAWRKEINKRIEEVESGKVKCIPYAEARKHWDKILGRS
jgi:hypothetical protein